jgi:hypothetical protein
MLLIASHATARNQTDECRKDWVFWESSHSKANDEHVHHYQRERASITGLWV